VLVTVKSSAFNL